MTVCDCDKRTNQILIQKIVLCIPVDVLAYSFSFLSLRETRTLLRVSTVWSEAAKISLRVLKKFKIIGGDEEPSLMFVRTLHSLCPQLQTLHIHREISEVPDKDIIDLFTLCPRIETLWAPGPLLEKIPEPLPNVSALVMGVRDPSDVAQLVKFTHLRKLTFTRYYSASICTTHIMSSMMMYPELEYFHTIGFHARTDFILHLVNLPKLKRLKLVSARLRDEHVSLLAQCVPQLRELSVCHNPLVTCAGLRRVSRRMTNLVYLYVDGTEAEGHVKQLISVCRRFRKLRRLRVSNPELVEYQEHTRSQQSRFSVVAM
eukprot:182735_1